MPIRFAKSEVPRHGGNADSTEIITGRIDYLNARSRGYVQAALGIQRHTISAASQPKRSLFWIAKLYNLTLIDG